MEHNTFRHVDALEYASAWNACEGLSVAAIELKLRALNHRLEGIEESGKEIPTFLLAAYRAYEAAIILRQNPDAFANPLIVKLSDE